MTDTAHIFNPQDDSLSERIRAYKSCADVLKNAKTSLELVDDKTWSDRLGSREEVEQAITIAEYSTKLAVSRLSQIDAERAVGNGLLSGEELKEFVRAKRHQNIQIKRNNQKNQSSSKFTQKR